MGIYLDRFRSAMPAIQGRQIFKILNDQKQRGQIRTLEEFKTKLVTLTNDLLSVNLTPSTKLFLAKSGEIIDSDTFNFMLERIIDDMSAAFTEAKTIDEVLQIHNNLISEVVIQGLNLAINELDAKISMFEFLNTNTTGFNDAQFNTFKGTKLYNTPRTHENASLVYIDQATRNFVSVDQDADIDLLGERLTLGADINQTVRIKKVRQIFDSEAQQTELAATLDPENKDLNNIVDGKLGTYWLYSVLLSNIAPGGVKVKLEFNLVAASTINSISLQPACIAPVQLDKIEYLNSSNTFSTLNIDPVIIDRPFNLQIPPITTTTIILTFTQFNFSDIQFEIKPGQDVVGRRNDIDFQLKLEDISKNLQEILASPFLLNDILSIVSLESLELVRFKEYLIGFDQIGFKYSTYDSQSIFVGEEKVVNKVLTVGLRVKESRPIQSAGSSSITNTNTTYLTSQASTPILGTFISTGTDSNGKSLGIWNDEENIDTAYLGSIEYTLNKIDYSAQLLLVDVTTIPLLPIGAEIVVDERLVLTSKPVSTINTVGQTRFYVSLPLLASIVPIDVISGTFLNYSSVFRNKIRVYRNGTEMPNKNEFITSVTGWKLVPDSEGTVRSPGLGNPMRTRIEIESPSLTDIYTITYVPMVSNTLNVPQNDSGELQIVDLVGDKSARLAGENIIMFSGTKNAKTIDLSKLYLTIMLRRNTTNKIVTPSVEEYMLNIGTINLEKFVSIE